MKKGTKAAPRARSTYRHGDLRRALLAAGIELARGGGPDAVVLREATRRAGRSALLSAVRAAALARLAVAMEAELARLDPRRPPADFARASLRAVGSAYLRFAQTETGLFRTAFSAPEESELSDDPAKAGHTGRNPFQLLSDALDRLAAAGLLPPARRPGAEYLAWSTVHGLAMLFIEGPLNRMPAAQRREIEQRLLKMVEEGL